MNSTRIRLGILLLLRAFASGFCLWDGAARAALTDEIQVYDAEINEVGQFSVELHNNFTAIGHHEPDFPGGIVPNHTLNGVPEWAYGVTNSATTCPSGINPAGRERSARSSAAASVP